MKISVFGTGYVGLVTGTCFAEMGNDVLCADIDASKIEKLQRGISPIYEPGLDSLLKSNLGDGRLLFTTDLKKAVEDSDILFVAVGTPPLDDGGADLQYVLQVARTIGEHMQGYKLVVNKSTVPVGTAAKVANAIRQCLRERGLELPFDVASNPEFLKEGAAIEDCLKPARVVIGCDSDRAREALENLYEPFLKNGNPLHCMGITSAEMTKYAANAMLATKISFMNELSRLCERVGADIESVRQGIGSDPRIGHHFIYPGIGYGGSCFPKDVQALIETAASLDENMEILRAVVDVNARQRKRFLGKIERHFREGLSGRRIAIWGLAFKPGTDDVREAPALYLINNLLSLGAEVVAYDPVAVPAARKVLGERPRLAMRDNMYECVKGADALILVTEWKPFREPDFARMKKLMAAPTLFDGRNIYSPEIVAQHGFKYVSIGRPAHV